MDNGLKVFFISEGGGKIGFGHITRCTSLYQAFEANGIVPDFIVHADIAAEGLLGERKREVFDWIGDKDKLFSLIKDADIAVVDSYLADSNLYGKISETARIAVYIDDNMRIDYPKGIVLNGCIGSEHFRYPQKESIVYLLGAGFIPLRKEFWDMPEKPVREKAESVMITFGGDDMRNMTPAVLNSLSENYPALTRKVVIGRGFNNLHLIEEFKDDKTELIYYPDAAGMKKVMFESDTAISAGGQTLYELARVGVPTIVVGVADNQIVNINGWRKAGFIEYAGWWEEKEILNRISEKIEVLKDIAVRQEKSRIGMSAVDGKGAQRIVEKVMRLYIKNNLTVRKAELKDMHSIYELSNDPEIRRKSFNKENIEFEAHRKWFKEKLLDNNCLFLVAEAGDIFIGQARFDMTGREAVISISISKGFRGFGTGREIMKKALGCLKENLPSVKAVKAYIETENISSIKYFENMHFQFIGKRVLNGRSALEYLFRPGEDAHGI